MRKDWEIKKIKDVCEVIAGQSPESKFYNNEGEGLPFYQGKKEFSDKFIGKPTTWTTKVTKLAQKDDILMSVRAPVGPVNFSTEDICIGRGLAAIRPTDLIDKEYLYYFLQKNENDIVGTTGAVFNSINKGQIENIDIPAPSLSEQQHIVEILNDAFEVIEKAKKNAVNNLQNAIELFKSYINSLFLKKHGWDELELGKVCDFQNGFAFKSKDVIPISNTQLIRMGNLYKNNLDLERKPVFYPDTFSDTYKKYLLKEGDLVISLTGTVGKQDYGFTVKIPTTEKNLLLNQRIAKIVNITEDKLVNDFLYYYLVSKPFLDKLYKTANGTRQANLSTLSMKKLPIYLPNISEQKHLVVKIESLLIETKKLEVIYQQKLTNLDELKKSILEKAFGGEL